MEAKRLELELIKAKSGMKVKKRKAQMKRRSGERVLNAR